jgi:hypothetical protein
MGDLNLAIAVSCETLNYPTAEFATRSGATIVAAPNHPLLGLGQANHVQIPYHATVARNAISRYAADVYQSLAGVFSTLFSAYVYIDDITMDANTNDIELLKLTTDDPDVMMSLAMARNGAANHNTELWNGAGATVDTHADSFTNATWHWLEVLVYRDGAFGTCYVYLDGSEILFDGSDDFGADTGDVRFELYGQTGVGVADQTIPHWANCCVFGDGGGDPILITEVQSQKATARTTFFICDKPNNPGAAPDFDVDGTAGGDNIDTGVPAASWSGTVADNNTGTSAAYYNLHYGAVTATEPKAEFDAAYTARKSVRYTTIYGAIWTWEYFRKALDAHAAAADFRALWGRWDGSGNAAITDTSRGSAATGSFMRLVPFGHAMCPDIDNQYLIQGFGNSTAPNSTKIVRVRDHWCCLIVDTPWEPARDIGPPNWNANRTVAGNDRMIK